MRKHVTLWIIAGLVLGIAFSVVCIQGCAKQPPKAAAVDYEALADRLVNRCAGIGEGDCVWVTGGVQDMELLEDIAVQVRKAGAFPLVTVGSDRMDRRMVVDVPEKWDAQAPVLDKKLFEFVTAILSVDYRQRMDLLADVPATRVEAMNQAGASLEPLFEKRRIRNVNLGNAMYPTAERAALYGVPLDTLSKLFWDGVNVDYSKLHAACETVKAALAAGKEIRLTHANGTDFTFGIENRPIITSDGIIPPDHVKKSGTQQPAVWLPAGEVITTPVVGTAKGKVVIERQFYQGKEIAELELMFGNGKLLAMTALQGIEPLMERYKAARTGKESFAWLDIGTNPNVRIPANSHMMAYMPSGSITIGIGGNSYYGGENTLNFGLAFFLNGYSLTVDGKPLVENGVLKI